MYIYVCIYIYIYIHVYMYVYMAMCVLQEHTIAARMHLHGTRDGRDRLQNQKNIEYSCHVISCFILHFKQ